MQAGWRLDVGCLVFIVSEFWFQKTAESERCSSAGRPRALTAPASALIMRFYRGKSTLFLP
jgi:hypothetical protein